jgi:phosphoribulokinase
MALPATTISATSDPKPTCSPNSKPVRERTARAGRGKSRHYVHDDAEEAKLYGFATGQVSPPGKTCRRTPTSSSTKVCTARRRPTVDVGRHVDLCVGVVPIINLEWIQKLHRDKAQRGYSTEAVMDTILRRMPDYINYICPQFSTDARQFPARADGRHLESVHCPGYPVARRKHAGDPFRQSRRASTSLPAEHAARLVHVAPEHHRLPGGKMGLAMQIIFTPMIMQLMDKKRRSR